MSPYFILCFEAMHDAMAVVITLLYYGEMSAAILFLNIMEVMSRP